MGNSPTHALTYIQSAYAPFTCIQICVFVHVFYSLCIHMVCVYCDYIRTNLRRFQPSNIKSNIRVLMFHYIMEYFSNLSCSCPLHEQPKDEIILLATVHVCLTA